MPAPVPEGGQQQRAQSPSQLAMNLEHEKGLSHSSLDYWDKGVDFSSSTSRIIVNKAETGTRELVPMLHNGDTVDERTHFGGWITSSINSAGLVDTLSISGAYFWVCL